MQFLKRIFIFPLRLQQVFDIINNVDNKNDPF